MKKITDKTIFGVHNHPLSLDSGNTVKHFLTSAAKDFGRTSIAITDHGQLGAIIEADQVAKDLKKRGIDLTIVPGIELYLIPDDKEDVWELDKKGNKKFQYYHVTVHFEDFEAYLEGCKLSRAAFDRAKWKGGELKPMTTWSELESLSGKVTLTSSCLVGQVLKPFLIGKKEQSEQNFLRLKAIQGPGRFFSEIFPYEVSKNWNGKTKTFDPIQPTECCPSGKLQVDANNWIKHLSQKHGVPMVVSEDAHYAHESEKVIQDLRLSRGNDAGWKMSDANCLHTNEWLFTELTRIHPDWMSPKLFDEMVDNSHMALSNFKGFEQKFTHRLPIIENTDSFKGRNSIEQSVSWVMETVTKHAKIDLANPVYKDRLNHEIKQLAYNGKVNVLPYFMPLYTITQWCKENDVLVGPGRGSAAGSLLSYAIDITQVDPIKEGLSFERFFDVTRVEDGLADIDTDFSDKLKVVEFAKKHWGDKFAYLGIGTTFKTKSSLKDIDRFLYGEIRRETDYVCKTIAPSPQGISEEDFLKGFTTADGDYIEGELEVNKDLVGYLKKNPESAKLLLKMVGIVRQMSRHAAGVLIADKPIHEFIPVMTVSDEVTTQLLPKWVEKCGGVKYDLLGVSTLEDVRLALNNVKQTTGVVIDPWNIEDSPDFWEAVAEDSATIFQLHTDTVKPGLKKMRPKNVEEASLLTSVFRPGAMDASANDPRDPNRTMADVFIDRWTGKERVKFTHPDLEPILKNSKAVIVFQEQIMQIAHQIGGLSMNDTNKLRRAISKKTGDELIRLLNQVKDGMLSRGWTEQQADETIEQMKASGRYAFNKAHACISEDQKVLTNKGPIPISEIVCSIDDDLMVKYIDRSGEIKQERPSYKMFQGEKEVLRVTLEDGSVIEATPDHRFFDGSKWNTLGELIAAGGYIAKKD